jgi:hypothetical protein
LRLSLYPELEGMLSSQSNLTLLLPTEAAMAQLPSTYTTELLNNKVVFFPTPIFFISCWVHIQKDLISNLNRKRDKACNLMIARD